MDKKNDGCSVAGRALFEEMAMQKKIVIVDLAWAFPLEIPEHYEARDVTQEDAQHDSQIRALDEWQVKEEWAQRVGAVLARDWFEEVGEDYDSDQSRDWLIRAVRLSWTPPVPMDNDEPC